MTESPRIDTDLDGPLSPPRDNGEIVFAAPWERRLFGVTVALCRSGVCEWEGFRQRLIRRIGEDDGQPYWQHWAAALEDVLDASSLLTRGEVDVRQGELMTRPPGHDHRH